MGEGRLRASPPLSSIRAASHIKVLKFILNSRNTTHVKAPPFLHNRHVSVYQLMGPMFSEEREMLRGGHGLGEGWGSRPWLPDCEGRCGGIKHSEPVLRSLLNKPPVTTRLMHEVRQLKRWFEAAAVGALTTRTRRGNDGVMLIIDQSSMPVPRWMVPIASGEAGFLAFGAI